MDFHCTREWLESPALLIDALSRHNINVEFRDGMLRGIGHLDDVSFCIVTHPKRFQANLSVWDYPKLLPLYENSPTAQLILEAFRHSGIAPVESPVRAELEYVEEHFSREPAVDGLIAEIREEERLVTSAVRDRRFEDARRHADQRKVLMDRLYDHCTS